jgi:hypothetical protein
MLAAAGVNTVMMSSWGERGSDRWNHWAPMQTSPDACDQLFSALANRDIYIVPVMEGGSATYPLGHSPVYAFREEYVGVPKHPGESSCPYLEYQIEDLIRRYLLKPARAEWPQSWARLYDREGVPRYAVMLMHVASDKLPPDAHDSFAAGFDRIADGIFSRTGVLVGFTLDILPPPRDDRALKCHFFANAKETGPALSKSRAVLAIQAFIPEIWSRHPDEKNLSDEDLLDSKEKYVAAWSAQGVPVIFDASLGYFATIFGDPTPLIYGNNAAWRKRLDQIRRSLPVKGVYVECWNGYTEGYAAVPCKEGNIKVPTFEYGNQNYEWLRRL